MKIDTKGNVGIGTKCRIKIKYLPVYCFYRLYED